MNQETGVEWGERAPRVQFSTPSRDTRNTPLNHVPSAKNGSTATVKLSPREMQIAQLVAAGLSDKEIGNELSLKEGTVGWYLDRIFHKSGVHSRAQLAVQVLRQSIFPF